MYFNNESNSTNIDHEFNEKGKFKINLSKRLLIIVGVIIITLLVIGIYMVIPKEPPIEYYLVLNGAADIVVYQDMNYIDPGYEAYDNKGNIFNQDVVVEGEVNTAVAGEYKIKYIYNNLEKERMVTVLAKNTQLTFLVLLGEQTMYLKRGEEYQEPGYKVIDSYDDDLENKVKITGSVNTNEIGTYKLVYSVINHLGVEFVEERTIIVLGTDVSITYSPVEKTNDNVKINIGIVDNYFDYVIYPDNTKGDQRYSEYEVAVNGTYKFLIYSKDGTYQEKTINISNIDKEKPTGSCSGYYQVGKSYITIKANDNLSDISKYMINTQSFMKNDIILNSELSEVTVTIYDGVGNTNDISCQLENKNTVVVKPSPDSGNSSGIVMCNDNIIYYGTTYNLTTSQKEKLAAMVYAEGGYNYVGMKAVASHMGNLYEIRKFNYPSTTATLYEFISTSTWYAKRTREMKFDGTKSYMQEAFRAVEEVLVQGKRTLPLYIDEFDWFPNDVVDAKDKNQYIQGKTVYYNKYGDENDLITFWCFNLNSNGTSGNIFGYLKRNEKYKNYIENR